MTKELKIKRKRRGKRPVELWKTLEDYYDILNRTNRAIEMELRK